MHTINHIPAARLIIPGLLFVSAVSGQSLDEYLHEAAQNNAGLRARFNEYQSALQSVPQVGALPDPQLSFGVFIEPMEQVMGNQVAEISLMQMFPWFGTLSAAKNEASEMAKARYESFNEAKSLLWYEVKGAWYELYLVNRQIAIAQQNLHILESLIEITRSRYARGGSAGAGAGPGAMSSGAAMPQSPSSGSSAMDGMNAMPQSSGTAAAAPQSGSSAMRAMPTGGSGMVDVLRVSMEINELKVRLDRLRGSMTPLVARFNQLLSRQLDTQVSLPDTLTPAPLALSVEDLERSIRENNPMLKMLEHDKAALLAQEKMNAKMGFPMIGIGVQYSALTPREGNTSMMNGKDMVMPMFAVTIPLWRQKYRAAVQQVASQRESVVNQTTDTNNQLQVSLHEALRDFQDAQRRNELYTQQNELAEQALRILTAQYSTGQSDIDAVMRMQQQLLEYRLGGLEALVDQAMAVAMLERLMGQ